LCRLPPLNGCTRTSLPKFSRSCHARRLLGSLEQCLRSSAYRLAQEGLADLGMCLIVRLAIIIIIIIIITTTTTTTTTIISAFIVIMSFNAV